MKRIFLLILPSFALAMEMPPQAPVYNVPSLKFLAARQLGRTQDEAYIKRLLLPQELEKYALFIKRNDELFKPELDLKRERNHEMAFGSFSLSLDEKIQEQERKKYAQLLAVDHAEDAQTMFENACLSGDLDEHMLADLQAINPDLNLNGTKIKSVIAACHDDGNLTLIDLLLEKGANIDHFEISPGITAIRFCCYLPNEQKVKTLSYLCQRGAFVDLPDEDGITPLLSISRSCNQWNPKIAELLLQHGAMINHQEHKYRTSPVMGAVLSKDKALLKVLLKHNPHLDLRDCYGRSAFITAAQEKNIEAMRLLKAAGANINIQPLEAHMFEPALIWAVQNNDAKVAFNLLEWGANIEIGSKLLNETALIHATRNNNINMVRLLLEYNANIGARDIFGKTPVLIALEHKHFELAQLFTNKMTHFPQDILDDVVYLALEQLVKTNRTELLKQLLAKGVYAQLQQNSNLNNQLLSIATSEMKELLQNYRCPEYYQLPWAQRIQFDAQQLLNNNRGLLGTGIGGAAVSAAAWYLLKRK